MNRHLITSKSTTLYWINWKANPILLNIFQGHDRSQHQSFNFWNPRFIRAYIPHFSRDHSVLNPHVMFRADSHGIRWHRSVLHIPCVLRIFSARLPARFPHGMVPREVSTRPACLSVVVPLRWLRKLENSVSLGKLADKCNKKYLSLKIYSKICIRAIPS